LSATLSEVDVPELAVVPVTLPTEHTELDLVLHVYQARANIRCVFEYRTALFDASTISRLAELYTALLARVSVAPEQRLAELAAALRARYEALRRTAHAEQQARQLARLGTTQRRRVTRP
jgi:non-ribosomal peptide synthetase component F